MCFSISPCYLIKEAGNIHLQSVSPPNDLTPNKVFSLLINIILWLTPLYLRWLWVFLHTAVLYPSIYVDFYQLSYQGSLFKSIGILLKTKEKNIMCRRQVLSDTGFPMLLRDIRILWVYRTYLLSQRANHLKDARFLSVRYLPFGFKLNRFQIGLVLLVTIVEKKTSGQLAGCKSNVCHSFGVFDLLGN